MMAPVTMAAPPRAKIMMAFWIDGEDLDAEDHRQHGQHVGDGRDDEHAPVVAEAAEEGAGVAVVEPGPALVLGDDDEPRVGDPRRQHVDPEDHHEGVAEALGDADDRVDDARVVDVLAARPRHAAGEDAPDEREAEADEHQRDDAGPEQVAGEIGPEAPGDHRPDAGRDALVHEADGHGVGHGETAHQAACFACECEFFCHTTPLVCGRPADPGGTPRSVVLRTAAVLVPPPAGRPPDCVG